ncbi:hypothetical protein GWK47_018033 [Chionoecetes opilio]|uniref:Uncharacterized protein n=1 Tax=Chionoecetes opilio TaxID=41210 RepID=A0A8J4XTE3_CHIOP|nr:hypothetical protein GWK47_018033 [Chionoecetes opilio]
MGPPFPGGLHHQPPCRCQVPQLLGGEAVPHAAQVRAGTAPPVTPWPTTATSVSVCPPTKGPTARTRLLPVTIIPVTTLALTRSWSRATSGRRFGLCRFTMTVMSSWSPTGQGVVPEWITDSGLLVTTMARRRSDSCWRIN